ncbi:MULTISPECIES: DUF4317 domain-containing protein [Mogibacterium]|jgi:hypothetical protein|uniref:DUF4317 domain-containing protein n=1 Tax=Mogibacterium TaxID=86331 RepID=UPI00027C3FCB|nr:MULTISPECIES: DUF4317 domain-containing protein [Mogibacterium]EJU24424.1 PF14199 domain protein [Mogibacterium sp. CM50]
MNRKEIREIKKRFNPDMDNFGHIYGCYVNAAHEIIAYMDSPTMLMGNEEREMYMKTLKKTLSGALGKNLLNVEFSTAQVEDSDEHRLLQTLRTSHLSNETMRKILFQRIIDNVDMGDVGYVILLASDSYDVPYKNGGSDEWSEESTDQFEYFICCLCPVKDPKGALRYLAEEQNFRAASTGSILGAPQMGFMFPTFDDRMTNIYRALYYTRSSADVHQDFLKAVFNLDKLPMAANTQKNAFDSALADSLGDECSMDVVKALHSRIGERIDVLKGVGADDVPEIHINELEEILMKSGTSDEAIEKFHDTCKNYFEGEEFFNPENLINRKQFKLETAEMNVSIDPEHAFGIKTEIIDGRQYLMIPISEGLTVNGVDVKVSDK